MCAGCGNKCLNAPSISEPAIVECANCNGLGCSECDERGEWHLTHCPHELLGNGIGELFVFSELMQKGLPPVQGGMLDQSQWFLDAARFIWNEHDRLEHERISGDRT